MALFARKVTIKIPHNHGIFQDAGEIVILYVEYIVPDEDEDGVNEALQLPTNCEVAVKDVEKSKTSFFFFVKENVIEIEA